ncbi:MAG TPA: hypothetical protein VG146_19280 [Verrucomicrobiae bacterium]|nr:hypothetical protein [Verrucomicrobiae bacterium]
MSKNPWHALEEVPGLIATPDQWRTLLGPNLPQFQTLCLHPAEVLPLTRRCKLCHCNHDIILRHDHTGAIAVCRCDPPTCPDIHLTMEQITPLQLNWQSLGRALCKTLQLNPKFEFLHPANAAQVGSWSSAAVPAILTIHVFPEEFRSTVAQLAAHLRRPFLLFAPTSTHIDATALAILENYGAAFFPLDTTVTLTPQGTLTARQPPAHLFLRFTPETERAPAAIIHKPRYALRKGLGVWHLIFDFKEADIRHEKGLLYVAWLLYNPPEQPIHAIDLMAKIPEIYRQQLGLAPIVDPTTGKAAPLQSRARIQERSLSLDDAQAMRAIFKKEKELEAILDSEDESEPVKAEALRELEAISEFQRRHASRSQDSARRVNDGVRKAIKRLERHLSTALDQNGTPHPVLYPFALHLQKYILTPSSQHPGSAARPGKPTSAAPLTYEPPRGTQWAPAHHIATTAG